MTVRDELARALRSELMDAIAMLKVYVEGHRNWDGSTRTQAEATIRDAEALIRSTRHLAEG